MNPWCHLHLNRNPVHSHERANTHSALNASTRSGYSGINPFPLSLSEPFAGEPSAGSQRSPLSVGVPSGLTFASKVSVFVRKITWKQVPCQPMYCSSDVFAGVCFSDVFCRKGIDRASLFVYNPCIPMRRKGVQSTRRLFFRTRAYRRGINMERS